MGFIERKGIIINPKIIIFSGIILVIMYQKANWENQYLMLTNFFKFNFVVVNNKITSWVVFVGFSLIVNIIWYIYIRIFGPVAARPMIKIFGGFSSLAFIDIDINKSNLKMGKFFQNFLNFSLVLFAMDFLLSSSLLFVNNEVPTFLSVLIAIFFITILEPLHLLYDGIGIRAYNKQNSEVSAITSVLDRYLFKILQTGGLLATFVSVSINTEAIDQIPLSIRVIFVRTMVITTFIFLIYSIFFQPKAIYADWRRKKIEAGKTNVKIYERVKTQ